MLKIAIITNTSKDIDGKMALRVVEQIGNRGEIYMRDTCVLSGNTSVIYVPESEIWGLVDIAIVIGGDGTLLGVAPQCAKHSVPVVGINLGKVGFLTEVEEAELEDAVGRVLSGDYVTEKRMLLKVRINDEEKGYHALNDTVITKPDGIKLLDVDLYSGDELVYHYRADGLVIATPTGSTGYSISAGGPVVDPTMNLYIATPICAHMLSTRSAVLPADKEVTVGISNDSAIVSTDGERKVVITPNDRVRISKSNYTLDLIKLGKTNFYTTLIKKLS